MALTFLRHTTPDVAKGICYGRTDLGVANSFEDEVASVLKAVPQISRVVTSPLTRCRLLAERVAAFHDLDMSVFDDLTEMDFGHWEMVAWDDIPRDELDLWAADFMDARPHGGESVQMLHDRVAEVLDGLSSDTLVVTHSGVIRAAAVVNGHPEGWRLDVAFGGVVKMG